MDETYLGGLEESLAGRQHGDKVLIVVAAQANGSGIGRVRMRVIPNASAASLHPFVLDSIAPGSTVHTDGWQGYKGLNQCGYDHEVTVLRGVRKDASKLLPRVHLVISQGRRQSQAPRLLPGRVHFSASIVVVRRVGASFSSG